MTASGPSRRSSSIVSATSPSHPASAAWSTKARRVRPAASSPSPATARSTASLTPKGGGRASRIAQAALSGCRLQARRPRHPLSRRLRRSVLGFDAWQRTPSSARTSFIAGPAAGASRPPSPRPMRVSNPARVRCVLPRCAVPHVDPVSRGWGCRGDRRHSGRRGDQAGAVDARRQADRGSLQPRRAQGVGRREARRLYEEVRRVGHAQMVRFRRCGCKQREAVGHQLGGERSSRC